MTFQQLADSMQLHILDLIPDEEQAEALRDQDIYSCDFIDGLIADGVISADYMEVYA